jgi:hypothetical protein
MPDQRRGALELHPIMGWTENVEEKTPRCRTTTAALLPELALFTTVPAWHASRLGSSCATHPRCSPGPSWPLACSPPGRLPPGCTSERQTISLSVYHPATRCTRRGSVTRRGPPSRKLTESLKPAVLNIVDESHKHAGHSGNPSGSPDAETHFKCVDGRSSMHTSTAPQGPAPARLLPCAAPCSTASISKRSGCAAKRSHPA